MMIAGPLPPVAGPPVVGAGDLLTFTCSVLLRLPDASARWRKPSDRRQEILLLGKERIAQLLRPIQLVIHHLQGLRHCGERLDTRIPWLLLHGIL